MVLLQAVTNADVMCVHRKVAKWFISNLLDPNVFHVDPNLFYADPNTVQAFSCYESPDIEPDKGLLIQFRSLVRYRYPGYLSKFVPIGTPINTKPNFLKIFTKE